MSSFLIYQLENRFLGMCCLCKKGILLNKEESEHYPNQQFCSECNKDNYYMNYKIPKKPFKLIINQKKGD